MKRIILYSLLFVFHSVNGFAQELSSLYREYMEENPKLEEDIKKIESRKKELLTITGKDNKNLKIELDKKQKDLSKKKTELNDPQLLANEQRLQSLQNEEQNLKRDIETLEAQVKALRIDKESAENDLQAKNGTLDKVNNLKTEDKASLNKRVEEYLQKSFGQMKTKDLEDLKTSCQEYNDDRSVQSSIRKIDNALTNKSVYDEARKALNGQYVASKVEKAKNDLNALVNLNRAQEQEISQVLKDLNTFRTNFTNGINVFQDFIKKTQDIPKNFSRSDFRESSLNKVMPGFKSSIESFINTNTYLKQKFDAYRNAIIHDPSTAAAIAKEIQNIKL